jgi:hypothetical protein
MAILLLDTLMTEAVNYPDMNVADLEEEIEFMFARNRAIAQFYDSLKEGTLSKGFIDEFCDVLNQHWIDPYAWLDNTQKNVGLILEQNLAYEL